MELRFFFWRINNEFESVAVFGIVLPLACSEISNVSRVLCMYFWRWLFQTWNYDKNVTFISSHDTNEVKNETHALFSGDVFVAKDVAKFMILHLIPL